MRPTPGQRCAERPPTASVRLDTLWVRHAKSKEHWDDCCPQATPTGIREKMSIKVAYRDPSFNNFL